MKKVAALTLTLAVVGGAHAQAIISNGTDVQIGVRAFGDLNVGGGTPATGSGTTIVGLRSVRTNSDSTSPGCTCEGWGVAIRSTGQFGAANSSVNPTNPNLSLVSFVSTPTTAVSVVNVLSAAGGPILRVTHNYHPLATTPYLYEVTVSITNLTGAPLAAGDLVYRRVMDWDIPSPGGESVTIQGVPAALGIANGSNVARTDNNGFNSANPLSFSSFGCLNTNFVRSQSGNLQCSSSSDQGAMFDFEFASLGAGATQTFNTYYGVAPDTAAADLARSLVDGDASDVDIGLYSYGSCIASRTVPAGCNPLVGTPDTFIFGFNIVGGVIVPPPPPPGVPEPATLTLAGLALLGSWQLKRRAAKRNA